MPATLIAAAPLVIVIVLIASRRVGVLPAGAIGWVLAVTAAAMLRPELADLPRFALVETLRGAWLAWQAVAVILAGMFFYRTLRRHEAALFEAGAAPGNFSHRRLFAVCFLLGPFAETATGFGVGCIIAVAALLRMGLSGIPAVVLALFSQMLVPWGALAVGTMIGASLAGQSDSRLAFASALLSGPLLAGYLMIYWRSAAAAGHPVPIAQRRDDALWTVFLALALAAASRVLPAELGCLAAAGGLLMLRYWRDERPDRAAFRQTIGNAAPYAVLTLVLIATRIVPPLAQGLRSVLVIAPFPDLPVFAVLYNPSFWLIAVAAGFILALGQVSELGTLLRETARSGWRPAAITLIFVATAQVLSAAGAARLIGAALQASLGSATLLAAPLLGAVGGFLTGSTSASNGMMMPVQAAMGTGGGLWPAAIQNTAASNFTLLSPIRISMALALAAPGTAEGAVYRTAWPIAVMLALGLMTEAVILALLPV
ncbi:MAG: lactate permease [Aliidongia sp.]|nr:lactate permease [Aliidongia sp.]